MPNWIKNKIMVGKKEFIDEIVRDHCSEDEDGNLLFDFNTLKKMPEELNVEFGSRSTYGLDLYLTEIDPDCPYFGKKEDKVSREEITLLREQLKKHMFMGGNLILSDSEVSSLKDKYKDNGEFEKVVGLGKAMVENMNKYNALNWYEWAVENWGTKWNSSSTEVGENELIFETAWDPAVPVFVELSRRHPNMKMALLYSDENIGCHVGYVMATAGHIDHEGSFPDGSKDAFKLAFDLWGCADEFVFDKNQDTYIPKPYADSGYSGAGMEM